MIACFAVCLISLFSGWLVIGLLIGVFVTGSAVCFRIINCSVEFAIFVMLLFVNLVVFDCEMCGFAVFDVFCVRVTSLGLLLDSV